MDRTDQFYRTEGRDGWGIQLKIGNGASPEQFQAIAHIQRIRPGGQTTETIDVTHLRSPNAHRELIAGLRSTAAFGFDAIWVPGDESQSNVGGGTGSFTNGGLTAIARNREEKNYIIEFTSEQFGSPVVEWPFAGVLTEWTPGELAPGVPMTIAGAIQPLRDIAEALP